MDRTYLIGFHLGPVQDFIATARRSRDLWFGSWLLSELAKAAASEIVQQNNNDFSCLIFPSINNHEELKMEEFNAPNKILALVSQDPEKLGKAAKEAIQRRLNEICDDSYRNISGKFDYRIAKQQLEDFLEFFWTFHPFSNNNYKEVRDYLEALLNARKMTRNFLPVMWGSDVFKCSLDGCRESVIPEKIYRQMTEEQLYKEYRVRRGECLCGVCLLKRHGSSKEKRNFFSTSHMAALPLLTKLDAQHRIFVEEYIGKLKELGAILEDLTTVWPPHPVFGPYDGELLFEERLKEFFEGDRLQTAKKALRKFLQEAFDGKKPYSYYALLLADGDYMGQVIDIQETPEKHRAFSASQSRFAREAKDIVQRYHGSLIYSGGDDVLAFLPLNTVLECATSLANTFFQRLAEFKFKSKTIEGEKEISPTLSVGIVIVHHLSPLSEVLELARMTEKVAKSVKDKNALAITLSKRSGADRTIKGKWGKINTRLKWFIKLHQNEAIPDADAYELRDLALEFEDVSKESFPRIQELLEVEIKRILQRKRVRPSFRPIAEKIREEIIQILKEEMVLAERPAEVVQEVANELIIAREFAEVMKLADMTSSGEFTEEVMGG